MSRHVIALGLGLALLLAAPLAYACSCLRYENAQAQMAKADIGFVGKVVAVRPFGDEGAITTFEIVETLKGTLPAHVEVEHKAKGCCICEVNFEIGATVTLFAYDSDGAYRTNGCAMAQFSLADYRAGAAAAAVPDTRR